MARKAKSTAPTAMEPSIVEVGAGPALETIIVRSHRIACDGVGGALGHPRVWLEMGAAGYDEDEQLAPGVYEGSGGH
jgi:uncharacterized Zn-finger protein